MRVPIRGNTEGARRAALLNFRLMRWAAVGMVAVPLGCILYGAFEGNWARVGAGFVSLVIFGIAGQTFWIIGRTFERWETRRDWGVPRDGLKEVWCLVGNVVEAHPLGEKRLPVSGSKHFRAGAKVFCLKALHVGGRGDGYERVVAIGRARGSGRWVTVVMRAGQIRNWRVKRVYEPRVMERLGRGYGEFKGQWESREEVLRWVEALNKRDGIR
jgi:hypothetical protein